MTNMQAEHPFSHFVARARATERKVDRLLADDELVRRLIHVASTTAALLDLYKKSFYHQQPIPEDLFESRLESASKALRELPRGPGSDELSRQDPRLLLALIGIFTEAGELLETLEPEASGEPYEAVRVWEELGDLNWYQAIALDELGTSLETVLEMNIAKLKARYPRRFTLREALHRDHAAERAALDALAPGRGRSDSET